jgi:aquaporin Z
MTTPSSSSPTVGTSAGGGDALADVPPEPGLSNVRLFGAELIGTAVLMLIGPGSAIIASDVIGTYGVAFAFGLALLAMAYTIGHVSGCHINPAVTLSFLVTRKLTVVQAVYYWVAQFVGAAIGGLIIYIITEGGDLDQTGIFAANGWGSDIGSQFGLGSAILVELVFTALLIFVVLATTTVGYPTGFGGLAAGLTLGMIHLATIPVDNTSVNPARSFGAAIYSGADAMAQLWVFIVFPLVGAVIGVLVWLLVHETRLEDTMLRSDAMLRVRDRAHDAATRVEDRFPER